LQKLVIYIRFVDINFNLTSIFRNLSIVFDQFIAPGNIQRDILISLVIGYFLYFLLAYTQHLWCRACSKLTLIPHLLIEDTFNFVMLMSIILLWRVYYIVPDLYFRVPHYQNEIYFLTHFLSFFASVLLNATVIMTGTGYEFKDGEISEDGDFFQLKFISSILEVILCKYFDNCPNRKHCSNISLKCNFQLKEQQQIANEQAKVKNRRHIAQ
jgi:hypothetical protein